MAQIQIVSEDKILRSSFKKKPLNEFHVTFSNSLKTSLNLFTNKSLDIIILDFRDSNIELEFNDNINFFTKKTEQYQISLLLLVKGNVLESSFLMKNILLQDVFCTSDTIDIGSFYWFLKRNHQLFYLKTTNTLLENEKKLLFNQDSLTESYKNLNIIPRDISVKDYPFYSFLLGESSIIKNTRQLISKAIQISTNSLSTTSIESGNILIVADDGLEKESIAYYISFISQNLIKKNPKVAIIDFKEVPKNLVKYILSNPNLKNQKISKSKKSKQKQDNTSAIEYQRLIENFTDGVLIINNIHLLTYEGQSLLLEALEKREASFFGQKMSQLSLSQLIFTVTSNIDEYVEKGIFRQDLLSKISTFKIRVPNLEERNYDLIQIIEQYLVYYKNKYKKSIVLTPQFKFKLLQYSWKENLNSLYTFLSEYCLTATNITDDFEALKTIRTDIYASLSVDSHIQTNIVNKNESTDTLLFSNETRQGIFQPSLENVEKYYIELILESQKGNVAEASRILGISRKTLYSKLKKYNLIQD